MLLPPPSYPMIAVDRTKVAAPTALSDSATLGATLCQQRRLWHQNGQQGDLPGADSAHYRHRTVKTALEALIGKKCWYCEDGARRYDIEHFYPQSIYPILAYYWENLLLACQICNQNYKKNQFPIRPGSQQAIANLLNPESRTDRDIATLIDPSKEDPMAHITFYEGRILSITERGRITIQVCGLDADIDLVDERIKRARLVMGTIGALRYAEQAGDATKIAEYRYALKEASTDKARFAGMVRAELSRRGYDWAAL
jgi:uncharacterized protein (TIGR02646 family)